MAGTGFAGFAGPSAFGSPHPATSKRLHEAMHMLDVSSAEVVNPVSGPSSEEQAKVLLATGKSAGHLANYPSRSSGVWPCPVHIPVNACWVDPREPLLGINSYLALCKEPGTGDLQTPNSKPEAWGHVESSNLFFGMRGVRGSRSAPTFQEPFHLSVSRSSVPKSSSKSKKQHVQAHGPSKMRRFAPARNTIRPPGWAKHPFKSVPTTAVAGIFAGTEFMA